MSEPINNANLETNPEPTPAKTFTQAEVDAMIGKRLAKAMKGMPAEEELTAFRTWKENQQTESEKLDNLIRERDEANTALSAAQAEIEQFERERYLLNKGVNADDVDYYAFKIGKLITDDLTFEKAAEKFLQEHTLKEPETPASEMRVNFGAPLSGGSQNTMTMSEYINNKLRGR